MSDIAISVEGLGKQYRLGANARRTRYKTLRESLVNTASSSVRYASRLLRRPAGEGTAGYRPEYWALRNVNFEVPRGQVLGIIGHNGAGKSTLLKLLSRITEPTEGRIKIKGRVASLLEVGTGFHPELTGRENIFLNGAILGMSRGEIVRKFDEIVAFAEVEKFIDTQVKHYSSGMYLRLAFAVAAHLEPEILVVDEVLAVGDAAFQKKCLGKMGEVAGQGRTVLVVSHNPALVRALCSRTIRLQRGELVDDGESSQVLAAYAAQGAQFHDVSIRDRPRSKGNGALRIVGVQQLNLATGLANEADILDPIRITIDYEVLQPVAFFAGEWRYSDSAGTPLIYCSSSPLGTVVYTPKERVGSICCDIPHIPFASGEYILDVALAHPNIEYIDEVQDAARLKINTADPMGSGVQYTGDTAPIFVDHHWHSE